MQKSKLAISVAIIYSLFLPTFVGAETATSTRPATTTRSERKDTIKQEMEERREAMQGEMEERKQLIANKIKEKLEDFVDRIEKRFNAAVERLENLSNRITSRIAKMDAEGKDTASAKILLETAKTKIAVAKASVALIGPKAAEVLAGEVRALFPELREVINKAKTDIKVAHAALVDVIRNLKPGTRGGNTNNTNATSTATTTAQ